MLINLCIIKKEEYHYTNLADKISPNAQPQISMPKPVVSIYILYVETFIQFVDFTIPYNSKPLISLSMGANINTTFNYMLYLQ